MSLTQREREGLERLAYQLESRLAQPASGRYSIYIVERPELQQRLDGLRARLASR